MSTSNSFALANKADVEKRVHELRRRDESVRSRIGPTLKHLWEPERNLALAPDSSAFDQLESHFPNFSPVIDYWRIVANAARKSAQPFLPQPILLGGLPGLGKTYFASEAAKVMGLHYNEITLSTVTASFEISGGSMQWGEGAPGFIARSLAESPIGNPVLLLDEIEKVSGDGRYNPMGPFFPLLESHSAQRFRDEALGFPIDASKVIWIATANEVEKLPPAILSRMRHFDIGKPTPQEMEGIVRSIYQMLRETDLIAQYLDQEIPESTVAALIEMLPRDARKLLQEACHRAYAQDSPQVQQKHLPKISNKVEFRMGFI
jgi:ATP-dependent Lon protease